MRRLTVDVSTGTATSSDSRRRSKRYAVRRSDSAWRIGIVNHRNHLDAEESLRANLDGLRRLVRASGADR